MRDTEQVTRLIEFAAVEGITKMELLQLIESQRCTNRLKEAKKATHITSRNVFQDMSTNTISANGTPLVSRQT